MPLRGYNALVEELSTHLSAARVSGIPVRVSVELGRSHYPLAEAVAMQPGQIVTLDRSAQAPADIYVDGMLYARGHLSSVEGRWAVKLEEILVSSKPDFLELPEPVLTETDSSPGEPEEEPGELEQ